MNGSSYRDALKDNNCKATYIEQALNHITCYGIAINYALCKTGTNQLSVDKFKKHHLFSMYFVIPLFERYYC